MSVSSLEPHIRQILCAPGTDLNTISAKRVRKQLLELEPSLTEDWIKTNKEQVDALIASVFEAVSAATSHDAPQDDAASTSSKRKHGGDDYGNPEENGDYGADDDDDDGPSSRPPPKPKKAKTKRELTDEEYARQLSSQINGTGRTSRSYKNGNGKPAKKAAGARSPKKSKKSAERVPESDDSDEDSDDGKKRKKKKKKAGGEGGAKGGFQKEFILSDPLATVLEKPRLSRPQVVKQLWAYIKENELQNPSNKREIMCDAQLRAVFNVDKIDMFKMNKVLGQHLHEQE